MSTVIALLSPVFATFVHTISISRIVPLLVKIVLEYCQCADDLPNLVSEVMSKLIDTLKVGPF